ncbi:MAG: universal stress protein [Candidatus Obscuribacterales bacterium]|nr:universal stress protein [Candidatus Obscuribacterales bacterium]
MNTILLRIQGPPICLTAADVAIKLARRLNSNIIAQFVIDPHQIMDLEEFSGRGLCGSGVFIDAQQKIAIALQELGGYLMKFFTAVAEGYGIPVEEFVDTGDIFEQIKARSTDASVIMLAETKDNRVLAEKLAGELPCPVIVVKSSSAVDLFESEQTNSSFAHVVTRHLTDMNIKTDTRVTI